MVQMQRNKRGQPRNGMTLVEVVTVLTLGSTLMMTAVGVMHAVMRSHSDLIQAGKQEMTWQRLEERLRQDIRSGSTVEIGPSELLVREIQKNLPAASEQPEVNASYRLEGEQLVRSLTRDGRQIGRDAFDLGPRQLSWEMQSVGSRECVVIQVSHVDQDRVDFRILAGVGQRPPRILAESTQPTADREEH